MMSVQSSGVEHRVGSVGPELVYEHRPGVRCLRAWAFAGYADVSAALSTPEFSAPPSADIAMMIWDGRNIFELNLVSAVVWDLLDGSRTVDSIVSTVAAVFRTDWVTTRREVAELCKQFGAAGLTLSHAVTDRQA
jgi:hypothetical protein